MGWNVILFATTIAFVPVFGYDLLYTPEQYESVPEIQLTTVEQIDEEYDFIVVGSGSAGAVVANRLSETATWNILLLEAGNPETEVTAYPQNTPALQFTDYNWGYIMEAQGNSCLAMEEQRCAWPRGKVLGGSSAINYMIYTRGNPEDYNRWAALGNPGWSYEDVLPYFLKSEDSHLKYSNTSYHHKGGYQSVENAFISELADAFVEAGKEYGYKYIDHNSPEQIGFSRMQKTIKFGRRHSTSTAFLKPVLHRKNLHILTGATVTKILIDPVTKKAQGVIYSANGNICTATARKEVVISAGVLNTPQLLMLSGVGPRAHLAELGIEPLNDLPVGQTLYDHPVIFCLILNTNVTMTNFSDPSLLSNWYLNGEGPLANIAEHEALAFIKTNVSTDIGDYPDIELVLWSSLIGDNGTINRRSLRISDDYYNKMYRPLHGTPSFTIVPVLLHPKSKGYMKLRSSNPYESPLFYGNYLTDPENIDVKTFIAGIRFIERLTQAGAFKKYGAELNTKPFVGCEDLAYNSDEYWECALRRIVSSGYHQMSTCKMGPADDKTAVVDHQLKVHGIGNLRVADASIIPIPLSAHTNAPSIMVGEMASDLIKKAWGAL